MMEYSLLKKLPLLVTLCSPTEVIAIPEGEREGCRRGGEEGRSSAVEEEQSLFLKSFGCASTETDVQYL
jgi:hypothetical protein